MPTGGNVADVMEGEAEAEQILDTVEPPKKKRKSRYQRAYKKAFKDCTKYKLKNGKWKKGGFKQAVKQAHKIAGVRSRSSHSFVNP